jgi:hypothetical protein
MAKLYILLADKHIQAAQSNTFDYAKGNTELRTKEQIFSALKDGKTIEEIYLQCIVRYGTITGAVMNSFLGHTSNSTRQAVRKGIKLIVDANKDYFTT